MSIARQFVGALPTVKPEPTRAPKIKEPASTPSPRKVGRPSSGKIVTTLRLDPDVIEAYKATGDGWQARMNADLRKARNL
jgi:uncharacterized protein (DUF4415 family)